MTGVPQQLNPQQPYGSQDQQPQWQPPVGKAPKGSVSSKVWGIILLILGVVGLLMLIMNVASVLGGGMSASTFAFNMSPEAKQELDRMGETMVQASLHRWSFWLNIGFEVIIAVVSVVAGFFLAIKQKPKGRNLAIARALIVIAALPVYGYESISASEASLDMMSEMQQVQVRDMMKQQEKDNPSESPEQRQRREEQIKDQLDSMQPFMKGATFGTIVFMVVAILVLNSFLLFSMTRPSMREYLESVEREGDNTVAGYDPSMGMIRPPPQAHHPGAAPSPGPEGMSPDPGAENPGPPKRD